MLRRVTLFSFSSVPDEPCPSASSSWSYDLAISATKEIAHPPADRLTVLLQMMRSETVYCAATRSGASGASLQ
jgi:hypothetical protein